MKTVLLKGVEIGKGQPKTCVPHCWKDIFRSN